MLQRHGYHESANTLAVASSEGGAAKGAVEGFHSITIIDQENN
jgi:hypothetical protein